MEMAELKVAFLIFIKLHQYLCKLGEHLATILPVDDRLRISSKLLALNNPKLNLAGNTGACSAFHSFAASKSFMVFLSSFLEYLSMIELPLLKKHAVLTRHNQSVLRQSRTKRY